MEHSDYGTYPNNNMFYPAEGIQRFFFMDTCGFGSVIYDNDYKTVTLTNYGYSVWGEDKRRFVVEACNIPKINDRRSRLAGLLEYAAYKLEVPTVAAEDSLRYFDEKLSQDGLQRIAMNPETFVMHFADFGSNAKHKKRHEVFMRLRSLLPVFEDSIPPGLVIASGRPENTGILVQEVTNGLVGAGAFIGGAFAVEV